MPFVSDDQRKAAFANMRRGGRNYTGRSNYGGQGGTTPKTPKTPKPKKPKKGTSAPAYGVGAVGYAGNYTSGAPSYANWYNSLPNTTAAPPTLAPSGSGMGGYGSITPIYPLTAEQFYSLNSEDQSFVSMAYDILIRQRNPYTGAFQPPIGSPGQFTVGSMIGFEMASDLSNYETFTYGGYGSMIEAKQAGAVEPVGLFKFFSKPYSNKEPGNMRDSVYQNYLENIGAIK